MSKSRTWGKQTLACVAAAVLALSAATVLAPQVAAQRQDSRSGTLSLAPSSGLDFWVRATDHGAWDLMEVWGRLWDQTVLVKKSSGWVILGPCWRVHARVDFWIRGNGEQAATDRLWVHEPTSYRVVNSYRWSATKRADLVGFKEPITISDGGYLRIL